jgi:hypothetical protein
MPSRLIKKKDGVRAGRDRKRDFLQMADFVSEIDKLANLGMLRCSNASSAASSH